MTITVNDIFIDTVDILYFVVTPSPTYGLLKNIFQIFDMPFCKNAWSGQQLTIVVNT